MTRIATKGPMGQKADKPAKAPRKGMRQVSRKKAAQRASPEGQADLEYMACVKQLACCICGKTTGVDAHHCQDKPPADEPHAYEQLPAAGRKSGARDTIPLCHWDCHQEGPLAYHQNKRAWAERNGPDYSYIPSTRAAVAAMLGQIDY